MSSIVYTVQTWLCINLEVHFHMEGSLKLLLSIYLVLSLICSHNSNWWEYKLIFWKLAFSG